MLLSEKGLTQIKQIPLEVLGEPGRHARSAMVAPDLPFGNCLEIELMAEVLGP